ncbi:MAG: DEAD/DEAH box helicase family protein [Candidatus Bathyarchaeia archaeon]
MLTIRYDRGTILLWGEVRVPYCTWDPRVKAFRAMALYYKEILDYLDRSAIRYVDHVLDPPPCPELRCSLKLRDYQRSALEAWLRAGRRGVIVLPTGAGKTVIAVKAIAELNRPALVVVPTLDLVEQWRRRLAEEFHLEVGVYGGGVNVLRPLTVSTYDSAYLRVEELGNRFPLVVFDEAHHLPAPGYSQIAEMFASPYRMGLTATYEREDGLHKELPRLIGGKVYELDVEDLAGRHLSTYTLHRVFVELTPEEQAEYDRQYQAFREYLRTRGVILRSHEDFREFIMRTGRDRAAREALLARNRALEIALNSQGKMEALKRTLAENPKERTLIFTQHNQLVHRISREFLIPAITHKTPREERQETLQRFKDGVYRAIVTSKVLDEGVDVPDATLAVILSGTGSTREFIQRLGRVLRKREGKKARLIEIVSKETAETRISRRRRRGQARREMPG